MRPQEPLGPPSRIPGPGGSTRPDAPGPYGSDGYDGRAPAYARPDDDGPRHDDPYGDVPAPASTGNGGVHAPYGASGWSGSDRYEPIPAPGPGPYGDPLDGGRPGGPAHGSNGNGRGPAPRGTHGAPGPGAPPAGPPGGRGTPHGAGPHGAGPYGPAPAPEGPPRGGPPWGAAPGPTPFGVPRPDGRGPGEPARPAMPPAGHAGGAPRPPAPPAPATPSSPPAGSPKPAARPAASAGEQAAATTAAATTAAATTAAATTAAATTAAATSTAATSAADGGGLAGSDGFASRPRVPREGATTGTTSTTTGSTRTGGAGVGPGRHRRAGTGPGRDEGDEPEGADEPEDAVGTGRAGRRGKGKGVKGVKGKRKGSFWRELPLLIVVAVVLTFVIQTFLARIYVIPSASMERTLHGCNGCANDRVAVDKVTYRFSDPAPGDVVVFRGPPAWGNNGEVSNSQRSDNVLIRGLQSGLSLVGLAPPDEKDFVKRVIAVGGQTVQCCDPQNRVLVDGQPLTEPYIYYQPDLGRTQADFPPVQVPPGQLWVMGDNRNNSADARVHGPIGVTDVIGKARVIVLPVGRWGGVPDTDPQARVAALGAPAWQSGAPLAAGVVGAVPLVVLARRWRRSLHGADDRPTSSEGGPAPPPSPGDPDR